MEWLQNWRGADPGTKLRHTYSNLGFGLLGEAVAIREGKPFAEHLAESVLRPLGLHDTTGQVHDVQPQRFMQPRFPNRKPATPWRFDALAGAGVLRSSPRDLAQFAKAVVRAANGPATALDRAILRSTQPLFELGSSEGSQHMAQCSGWMSTKGKSSTDHVLFANGGTAGSTCALYICPAKNSALGILSNNGIAANLWASAKLSWSNPLRKACEVLLAS